MGGMARRAAVLDSLRGTGAFPVVYIAGAEEFASDTELPDPAKTGRASASAVRTLWEKLRPDAGYLSEAAWRWFGEQAPAGFFPVQKKPVTRRLKIGSVAIAVIFFPPLSAFGTEETETPTPALLAQVLSEANAAADADVRIGVSPWGFQAEYDTRAALAQSFHVLLGAGPGAPFELENDVLAPGLLWSRADHDGRSVMAIDLLRLPDRRAATNWTVGGDVVSEEQRLTEERPEQPAMRRLLEGIPR